MMKDAAVGYRQPLTILPTTHLVDEADCCDRIGILNQGRLVAADTPANMKARIGGDAIDIRSPDPQRLCVAIGERFGATPILVDDIVRIERENGHVFVTQLVEAFPGMITTVTVRQPTLDDVFLDKTGHRFDT